MTTAMAHALQENGHPLLALPLTLSAMEHAPKESTRTLKACLRMTIVRFVELASTLTQLDNIPPVHRAKQESSMETMIHLLNNIHLVKPALMVWTALKEQSLVQPVIQF
jgi:hypothetical protein